VEKLAPKKGNLVCFEFLKFLSGGLNASSRAWKAFRNMEHGKRYENYIYMEMEKEKI
jgi:hypothetical protein